MEREFSLQLILNDYQKTLKKIIESDGLTIKPGVIKLLENLEKRGIKKCIASSSSRETFQHHLAMTGLTNRFDFYISGEEVTKVML
jgi:beta-phosphoglucomutase-like phosphatase (HAD superfamily)